MRQMRTSFLLLLTILAFALVLTGCGGDEPVPGGEGFDPLAVSGPSETVARAMRLAGFEEAIVGNDRSAATVWLRVPEVNSAADVELAWQAGVASLAAAYPSAKQYVVQIASDTDLLEVRVDGGVARDAIESDDAAALHEEADFIYLGRDASPSSLPQGSYDATDEEIINYLDTKNRVNGLVGDEGLMTPQAEELLAAAESARIAVPGIPAVEPGGDAGLVWSARAVALLGISDVEGARDLIDELREAGGGMTREDVQAAREWFHVVSAVEGGQSYGSVLAAAHGTGLIAGDGEVAEGPGAEAILVAIRDRSAPPAARAIELFERAESADTSGTGEAGQLPDITIAANGGESAVIAYLTSDSAQVVETDVWLAYDREDSTRFWLAGEDGVVALTDGSVRGWVFNRDQAALVSADDVGRWFEVFPTR